MILWSFNPSFWFHWWLKWPSGHACSLLALPQVNNTYSALVVWLLRSSGMSLELHWWCQKAKLISSKSHLLSSGALLLPLVTLAMNHLKWFVAELSAILHKDVHSPSKYLQALRKLDRCTAVQQWNGNVKPHPPGTNVNLCPLFYNSTFGSLFLRPGMEKCMMILIFSLPRTQIPNRNNLQIQWNWWEKLMKYLSIRIEFRWL